MIILSDHWCASNSTHSIISTKENLKIPLPLKGIISYFPVRTPTVLEIKYCQHIFFTSKDEWNPNSSHFEDIEDNMTKKRNASVCHSEYPDCYDILVLNINEQQQTLASMHQTAISLFFVWFSQLLGNWH